MENSNGQLCLSFSVLRYPVMPHRRCAERIVCLFCLCGLPACGQTAERTRVTIVGEAFHINGRPTYQGCVWEGRRIEGLLFNARVVQGIFDDLNPETVGQWAYPDTGVWDPDRNTNEFVAAMSHWRSHGLLAVTVNLQGGCPHGYCSSQPWINSAIAPDGQLRPAYMQRLQRICDRADALGMVVILGLFYFGQDQTLVDEAAVVRGVDNVATWLQERGYRNVVVEINNECDLGYEHAILQPARVHELIQRVQSYGSGDDRLLAGTSFSGGALPTPNVVAQSDFILLHGNGVDQPQRIREMVARTRQLPGYRPMPILFNEDDHFDFDREDNNLRAAIDEYASWGFFDPGAGDYSSGYQCVPVNWGINTPNKRAFFCKLTEITNTAVTQRGLNDACCDADPSARSAGIDAAVPATCGAGLPAALALTGIIIGLRRLK